ncbi:uncharacterized protein LOC116212618 isoform X2 [Punica granatum]|uniref:Uncharacterized protein LOC116212618 isoform X2 n=1 Tax=Punica granatum TaxID=22663 RepID=A0A6P8ECG6_PUNGR|nr:uncharacterized protein LOC116212618 isoform X2 [Punica granatum]
MVLGQKTVTRNSKRPSVQLEYVIHIQDIKPWPPSPLLRSLRSVLIHWENGERSSGSTRSVTPNPGSVPNDGKIEFNESFRLPVTLLRDMSVRTGNAITFQKNFLAFNLYEPRRDNILKGQLIATAIIDLANYGVVDEPLSVSALLNCKRSFRNMAQPFLHIRIQPIEKGRAHSSSCGSASIELSAGEHDGESISASLIEEYAEEAEIASFTEDDNSSLPPMKSNGSSPIQNEQVKRELWIFSGTDATNLEDTAAVDKSAIEKGYLLEEKQSIEDDGLNIISTDNSVEQGLPGDGAFSFSWESFNLKDNHHMDDVSTGSPLDTVRTNGYGSHKPLVGERHPWGAKNNRYNERKEATLYPKDRTGTVTNAKVQQLQHRIQGLKGELREAAALEISLFAVIAEHGCSSAKLHAPARRLSRFYHHACRELSQQRRASAARSALSGLVLVAKASGNDVPRLTYWLSNCAVLRATLSWTVTEGNFVHPSSNGKESFLGKRANKSNGKVPGWDDLHAFIGGLENIEAWIFSRVVESIWWQIVIPHMQSASEKASNGGKQSREAWAEDQMQAHVSFKHWKKVFKEARERLCPAKAGGQTCGCLPVLARLIMEQCVARLDVAMFNAVLRKSGDEIPTDPQSDPIGESKVLPIPVGKLSFKAGAQLKNVIGNWSRWLTDHFGVDDGDLTEDGNGNLSKYESQEKTSKPFHLLNALSDLMMLPKDLLLSGSVRKEVCPTFGAPLIKRALENFVPDEFCPNPVPKAVLEALASEETTNLLACSPQKAPLSRSPYEFSHFSLDFCRKIIWMVRSIRSRATPALQLPLFIHPFQQLPYRELSLMISKANPD